MSIVIATLDRGEILLRTIRAIRAIQPEEVELIVVDQTSRHAPESHHALSKLDEEGAIRWLRQARPSIPAAMNRGLREARGKVVLFVDDDIVPSGKLIAAHLEAHDAGKGEIIAGQVLQPGEQPEPLVGPSFGFRSSIPQAVSEVIGCNFSVDRAMALNIGGFDELFVKVAYRFEADFCDRARAAGATIVHEPAASLRHLKVGTGGTRSYGNFLTSWSPAHAVGEYYYLLRRRPRGAWQRFLLRPLRAIRTRHHLRRPWWIPATLIAELAAIVWAVALVLRAPRLLSPVARAGEASA